MLFSIGVITALVASAVAAPADKAKTTSTTSSKTTSSTAASATCKNPTLQNANFDDLAAVPGTALNPIPIPYKGLYFQGFQFSEVVNNGALPDVLPHSAPNYAFTAPQSTLTSGTSEFTTVYTNSKVASFDLYSLYYGCLLGAENAATAVPTACNIAVTGYASGDNTASTVQVAAQSFSYNPSTSTGAQQMTSVTFNSSFKNLQYVLVQYTLPGGTSALQADSALVLDDIMYRTCST